MRVLKWLTKIDYGPQHSDLSRKRQPGTGQWLLKSAEYQRLVDSKGQTLFCPGDPGVGKPILTATIIDDLITRFPHVQSTRIVYIYCNFNREHEQRLEYLIAALIKQLSQARPSLPKSLTTLYNKHQIRRTRPSAEELSRVPLSVASLYTRIFVVVDALDECQRASGCRSRFLSQIFALQDAFSINVFATSRPIPEIEETFEHCLWKRIIAPEEDIRSFLHSEMHMPQMPKLIQRDNDLQKEISSQIVDLADGM
jgi:Cdc6-like AAA superfamily ATPase